MFDWWSFVGIIGMSCVLIAFLMMQFNQWRINNINYHLVNFFGGIFLMSYAISGKVFPFVVLNFIWAVVSLVDVLNCLKKKK